MDRIPKYNIGDTAWRRTFDSSENYTTCPECGGDGRIRCILFDGTELSIDCEGCKQGYLPPTGRVRVYDRVARARLVSIDGFEVGRGGVEYRTNESGSCSYIVKDTELFDTEQAALNAAAALVSATAREEREKINRKEKPTRTWSYHVHYHRNCIRRAEKDIAYHTAKLNVAKIKAEGRE